MRRNWIFTAILGVCLFALIELSSFLVGRILQRRLVFYNQPSVEAHASYLADRHKVLGWPSGRMQEALFDATGSRPIPAYPEPGAACVSLYGDSFTFGAAVDDTRAWSNLLSRKLGCRVANYGVPGFGLDQALLYFESKDSDEAPIVLLNLFSGDVRRHVNQLGNLIFRVRTLSLKPRFVLEHGALKLIPIPAPSRDQAEILAEHPESVLRHEYFLPGGNSGIRRLSFPYSFSILRALGNEHVRAKIEGVPVWAKFYEPDHPSGALEITFALMERFVTAAEKRGKRPLLTLIPNAHDIEYYRETRRWSYQPLLGWLEQAGLEYLDMGPGLIEYLGDRNPCEIAQAICYGHYAEEGHAAIAGTVADYLSRQKIITVKNPGRSHEAL